MQISAEKPTASQNATDTPLADTAQVEQPRKPSFPVGAVLCLVWAALGPAFHAEADHFGAGFLPSIVWLISLPLLILFLLGATIYKIDSYLEGHYVSKGSIASIAIWPVTLLLYVVVAIYLFS